MAAGPKSKAVATRLHNICLRAEAERMRILHQDILGQHAVHLYAIAEDAAGRELARFANELWHYPRMHEYFDRRHFANLRDHLPEAHHGFTTLASGGVMEILSVPAMPAEVMGFHFFTVFDPKDETDVGRFIGYAVWSLEKGQAPYGRAEAVRMAFDIFPPFREGHYRKVRFTNHEIYNISRCVLYRFRPSRFLVDARTQILQTRTGIRQKRALYYLKRGYYPPDQKTLADACLDRLARGQRLSKATVERLLKSSRAAFWTYPVARYVKTTQVESGKIADSHSTHGTQG